MRGGQDKGPLLGLRSTASSIPPSSRNLDMGFLFTFWRKSVPSIELAGFLKALNVHPSPCHKSSLICPLMKAKQTNFIFLSPSSFPFFLLFYFLPASPPSRGSVKGHRGLQLSVCAEELFPRQQFSQQRCNYEILPKHIGYYWMCHFWILAKGFGRNRTREEKREKNYAHVSLSILLLN